MSDQAKEQVGTHQGCEAGHDCVFKPWGSVPKPGPPFFFLCSLVSETCVPGDKTHSVDGRPPPPGASLRLSNGKWHRDWHSENSEGG